MEAPHIASKARKGREKDGEQNGIEVRIYK